MLDTQLAHKQAMKARRLNAGLVMLVVMLLLALALK